MEYFRVKGHYSFLTPSSVLWHSSHLVSYLENKSYEIICQDGSGHQGYVLSVLPSFQGNVYSTQASGESGSQHKQVCTPGS